MNRGNIKSTWTLKSKSGKAALYQGRGLVVRRPRATRGVSLQAAMRSRAKTEVKGVDILLTQAAPIITTTGTNANALVLNCIQPGSGSWNRIGRKVHLKSLRMKGSVAFTSTPSAAGAENGNFVRIVVVWDQQPSGAAVPTWDTIFGITDQTGTESSTIMSPPRYDNMDRFTVLKDFTVDYQMQPSTPVSTAAVVEYVPFDCFISLAGREVVFSGQSNPCTIADISTGALYVYFRAITADASQTAQVPATSVARLRYSD